MDHAAVRDFWESASCGELLYLDGKSTSAYSRQADKRYELEPYIVPFADFASAGGRDVLEIGPGLGADHLRFAQAGARLHGIDLTARAIDHTRRRLEQHGLQSDLRVGDAESLPFPDASFDIVYSWGVIHHSPDTQKAAREILRVLRPGGRFAVMIYNRHSLVGYMLWLRYALMRGRPLTGLAAIYSRYLESPGTKAYSPDQARELFAGAADIAVRAELTHGDLLQGGAGQRHRGAILSMARAVWPRWLLKRLLPGHGLFLLVAGRKPA